MDELNKEANNLDPISNEAYNSIMKFVVGGREIIKKRQKLKGNNPHLMRTEQSNSRPCLTCMQVVHHNRNICSNREYHNGDGVVSPYPTWELVPVPSQFEYTM